MKSGSIVSILAAAGLAATHMAADAQDTSAAPDVYKPAGQWTADYGDDYCRLSRNVSDGANTMAVAMERIQPGPTMELILVGPDLKTFRTAADIGWHFTPDDPERKARAFHSQTADGKQWYDLGQVTISALPPPSQWERSPPPPYDRAAEQATAKGKTGLLLDGGLTTPVQIDTGDLAAPIAALQACADDLAKSWGLDPAKLVTEKSPAVPKKGDWLPLGTIPFADYPKLTGGANRVRLMIDATGKPTACVIHKATLDKSINDKVCQILMDKAEFTPAMGADGQPMAGYWVGDPLVLGPSPIVTRGRG